MKKSLVVLFGFVIGFIVIGSAYYFGGHHNHVGSRSFYLEKDIRNLLYLETHEPIDYEYAADTYREILSKIRFDDSKENLTKRYKKGLARAQFKAQAQANFDLYKTTSNKEHILNGWAILSSPRYLSTEEYNFTTFYWHRSLIDERWIKKKTQK